MTKINKQKDMILELKKYFEENTEEQILKDWEETKKANEFVNSPTVEQFLLYGVVKSVCDCERCEDIYRTDVYKCGKCHLKVPR